MRPDLTMVVPTYNERDRLGALLERIFAACEQHELRVNIVVVDDNSADGTGDLADEWARHARVSVIHRAGKLGLGSAVLEGIAIADSDVVGVMDADLSHPPELIPRLYGSLAAYDLDMVVASRYVRDGGTRSWTADRFVLSHLGCWLARPLTPVRDAMSGFFLMRRNAAMGFRTSKKGFKIGLDLLVRAPLRRVAELGYVFVGREAGESKMSVGEGLGFLKQLAQLYAYRSSSSRLRPSRLVVSDAALQAAPTPVVEA